MTRLRFVEGEMPARTASLNNTVRTVRAMFETEPAIVRAMLPKPLVPAERPEVFCQFAHVAMHVSPQETVEIGALTLALMCDYQGKRGGYVYHMSMEGETVVTSGRERFGEPKKIAETRFSKDGDSIHADVSRHGVTFFTFDGTVGEELPLYKPFEEHFYCYKGMPSIAEPGKFDGDVWLTRLNWKRDYAVRRALTGQLKFHESKWDPVIDVPVLAVTQLEYVEGATNTSGQLLEKVPGEWIAPFWVQRNDVPANPGIEVSVTEPA